MNPMPGVQWVYNLPAAHSGQSSKLSIGIVPLSVKQEIFISQRTWEFYYMAVHMFTNMAFVLFVCTTDIVYQ